MKSLWIKDLINYDGTQLRSLYAYLEHKTQGDSIIAWRGPCSISFDHMVDGEDLNEQSPIAGSDMLHFIIEKFHLPLTGGVLLQRYFAAQAMEVLREKISHWPASGAITAMQLRREGDDIYFHDGKMSISIATVSPVSSLVHFAINVTNEGTPVKTASLSDFFGHDHLAQTVESFARDLMERFITEIDSADIAAVKVRWVR